MPVSAPASSTYDVLRLPEKSPLPGLFRRIGAAVGAIVIVSIMLYFGRDGLRDNMHPDREMGFVDVLYFTIISLTTVGYGDIVPVTPGARFFNSVFLTPVRIFVWVTFLGTTYEIFVQRFREGRLMAQLREKLKNHTVVCGFGVKGQAIVDELLAHGHPREQIVVIEPDELAVQNAASLGYVALKGDASSEQMLRAANIEDADHILVAPHRDDECVLICLTARQLNEKVRIIASVREEENIKLLYRAGADVVVAPSVAGGRMMSAAVRQKAVVPFLQDLLVFGQGLDAVECTVLPNEVGQSPCSLERLRDTLILGVQRGEQAFRFHQLRELHLQEGDVIVYLTSENN
ncbi:MAG TPA: potassium channel family protein [Abditibacteriaceae bacterium]|jgi:voltage-gated potassium channel